MKKAILLLTLCVGLFSCGNNQTKNTKTDSTTSTSCSACPSGCSEQNHTKSDVVEVLYFHGKQRCATCMAIEKNTKELVETTFADQIKSGKLAFKIVDITKDEELAEKYEITWSSLVLVDYNNGAETSENLTEFAFANARTAPDKFKAELKNKLENLLNN